MSYKPSVIFTGNFHYKKFGNKKLSNKAIVIYPVSYYTGGPVVIDRKGSLSAFWPKEAALKVADTFRLLVAFRPKVAPLRCRKCDIFSK